MSDEAWWPDPRSFVGEEDRSHLEEDPGFRALFDSLQADGPKVVPSRRKAAQLSKRSEASFKREFPRLVGGTWRAFLTNWRVLCVRVRLKRPFLPLKAVARDCGFRSVRGLSRAYHRRFGEFPRHPKRSTG